jgi:glycosyl transferase family 1/glycosyl transferase family 4
MRILHLDSGREMRGGQWQVLRLVEGLREYGVESALLARQDAPLFRAACERMVPTGDLTFRKTASWARQCDLVHAHDARSHTIAVLVRGAPLVVSRRVIFPIGWRWKYAQPVRYIAVSDSVRGVLMAGGVPREKITVVSDGVPVLDVARGNCLLSPEKGASMAVQAARLAGQELNVSTDLERDLLKASGFVYFTESEGLGSAVLLAMSAGVPVIASNVGGLREVISHGENGLLVENTPQAFASAIRQLLDDRDLAQRLGAAGRRTVIQRFTLDHMVRRTMEVYQQVLS